jgi:hypothetical protein
MRVAEDEAHRSPQTPNFLWIKALAATAVSLRLPLKLRRAESAQYIEFMPCDMA